MFKHTLNVVVFCITIVIVQFLSGCGGSSPNSNNGSNIIQGAIPGTISGAVYNANTMMPLASATIIADNKSTLSDTTGNYSISGLGNTVTISAAMSGYGSETIVGIPTTVGQNIHLPYLNPVATITPMSTMTITGILMNASGVPAAFQNITCYGNIVSTNASGQYTITLNFPTAQAGTNATAYSIAFNSTNTMTEFGYITIPMTPGANITAPILQRNFVTTTPMTISVSNVPAGVTNGSIFFSMKLPTGEFVWIGGVSNTVSNPTIPTLYTASAPNILGATYIVTCGYNDGSTIPATWVAGAGRTLTSAVNTNISLIGIPNIISPSIISAASPATLSWSGVAGAQEYNINLWNASTSFDWRGFTSLTSITKPIFIPANGGNLISGFQYSGQIEANDTPWMGTSTTSFMNPLAQSSNINMVTKPVSTINQSNAYVVNQINAPLNYTYSARYFTITAN